MYKAESLPSALQNYVLPVPPRGIELRDAIKASLGILDVVPDQIGISLLAAIYGAPIIKPDYSIFITGPTGAGKSQLAALAQQHYGAGMDSSHLPCSWSSTANANELVSFHAKDAIITIDDFCPGGSSFDVQKQHKEADRILRAQGNKSGRSRMTSNLTMAKTFIPRGLILNTGEDIPKGHSLRARLWVLELGPDDVDFLRLSNAQQDAASGRYAQAMAGYLQWISPQYAQIQSSSGEEIAKLRDKATSSALHRRTPAIAASLAYGLSIFLKFATQSGAITLAVRDDLWARCWGSIGRISSRQSSLQSSGDPVERFIELVRAAIESQTAHIASISGSAPENAETWGWKNTSYGKQASGTLIGWSDGDDIYLQPDACFKIAQEMAKNSVESLSISAPTLWKRMDERKLLKSKEANRDRLTVRKSIAGNRPAVIHLDKSTLWSPEPAQPSQEDESDFDSVAYEGNSRDKDRPIGTGDGTSVAQIQEVDAPQAESISNAAVEAEKTPERKPPTDSNIQWQDGHPCRICEGTRYWIRIDTGARQCQTCHPCPATESSSGKEIIGSLLASGAGNTHLCFTTL